MFSKFNAGLYISSSASNLTDVRDSVEYMGFTSAPNNSYPITSIGTFKKIDVTNYSKLRALITDRADNVGYGYNVSYYVGLSQTSNSGIPSINQSKYNSQTTSVVTHNFDLDISNLIGEYYIIIALSHGPSYAVHTEIKLLELE